MKRYKAGLIFLVVFMNTGCNDNQEKDKTEPLSDTCYLTPDPGLCMAAFPRYYYDSDAEPVSYTHLTLPTIVIV